MLRHTCRFLIRVFAIVLLGAVFSFAAAVPAARAAATISSWSLDTGVVDLSPPSEQDVRFSFVPQNPFSDSHNTQLPISGPVKNSADSYFFASWLVAQGTGHFDLTFDQQINGRDSFASTSGSIYLTSDTDLFMNFSAVMTFASSAQDEAAFELVFSIRDSNSQGPPLWGGRREGGRLFLGTPASGSAALDRMDLLVPAGPTYLVSYLLRTSFLTNALPQSPLTNDGTLHFDWRPVPEPAALGLLLAGAMMLRHKTRRP